MKDLEDIEIETLLERIYLQNKNGDARKSTAKTPEEYERIWNEILPPDDS